MDQNQVRMKREKRWPESHVSDYRIATPALLADETLFTSVASTRCQQAKEESVIE
jgi:hypothetical protein